MSLALVTDPSAALHQEIGQVLLDKERARQTVEQEKLRTYWQAGPVAAHPFLQHQDWAGCGEQPIGQLAADLEMSQRVLYEILGVYRAYPILRTCAKSVLSHDRGPMPLPAAKWREIYARQVVADGLSGHELRSRTRADTSATPAPQVEKAPAAQVRTRPDAVP